MKTAAIIFAVICAASLIFMILCLIAKFMDDTSKLPIIRHLEYDIDITIAGLASVMVFVFSLAFAAGLYVSDYNNKQWEIAEKENWTFYINGSEVDSSNVVMSQYKVSFDEDNHKVLMATKK